MLTGIELQNFRSWSNLRLDFGERTILVGPNGSGKTNILEAIYLLGVTRSWRAKSDRDLVKWDADVCRVVGMVRGLTVKQIEFAIQREPYLKKIRIDGVEKKATDTIGKIVVVLFDSRSSNLVYGQPAVRRRFLDVLLAQVDQQYTLTLIEMSTVLKQRNVLLKRIRNRESQPSEIKFWDSELIRCAEIIWQARSNFFRLSEEIFSQSYVELAGSGDAFIKYEPSVSIGQSYKKKLEECWNQDLEQGSTSLGPHHDDFVFILKKRRAVDIASQGETRSLVLALKKAEVKYLSEKMGKNPILLLDDIFSELDTERRRRVASTIGLHQAIITTTDLSTLDPRLCESFSVVDIGKLKQ